MLWSFFGSKSRFSYNASKHDIKEHIENLVACESVCGGGCTCKMDIKYRLGCKDNIKEHIVVLGQLLHARATWWIIWSRKYNGLVNKMVLTVPQDKVRWYGVASSSLIFFTLVVSAIRTRVSSVRHFSSRTQNTVLVLSYLLQDLDLDQRLIIIRWLVLDHFDGNESPCGHGLAFHHLQEQPKYLRRHTKHENGVRFCIVSKFNLKNGMHTRHEIQPAPCCAAFLDIENTADVGWLLKYPRANLNIPQGSYKPSARQPLEPSQASKLIYRPHQHTNSRGHSSPKNGR